MKDFLLSQYPINAVVILWVSSLAKRYVSNNATGCDSDSIFFFNFFALLTLKDFTIYTLQYITRTKKKKIEQITQMIKGKMCAVAN